MVKTLISTLILSLLFIAQLSSADGKIELKMTTIKSNKELPKILYVVPWQDIKQAKNEAQTLELHSLFGDLFDPLLPRQYSLTRHDSN